MRYLTIVLDAVGGGCIVAGTALVSVPAAFILAGVLAIAFSYASERRP